MILIWLISVFYFHPLHISTTHLKYVAAEQRIQISLHLFIDDVELALRQQQKDHLFLGTERETPFAKAALVDYLNGRFSVQINEKPVVLQFKGHEPSDDLQAIWCYLSLPVSSDIKQLTVQNALLLEVHPDQQNMIAIEWPSRADQYEVLDQNHPKASFKW